MTPAIRAALECALKALPDGEARRAVMAALAEFEPSRVDLAGKNAALAAFEIDEEMGF